MYIQLEELLVNRCYQTLHSPKMFTYVIAFNLGLNLISFCRKFTRSCSFMWIALLPVTVDFKVLVDWITYLQFFVVISLLILKPNATILYRIIFEIQSSDFHEASENRQTRKPNESRKNRQPFESQQLKYAIHVVVSFVSIRFLQHIDHTIT